MSVLPAPPFHHSEIKAINLGFGQSPMSRRLFLAFFAYAEKFSHGLPALNHHAVGIVYDAVANRVSHNLRADFVTPALYVKLRTENN